MEYPTVMHQLLHLMVLAYLTEHSRVSAGVLAVVVAGVVVLVGVGAVDLVVAKVSGRTFSEG